VSKIEVFVMEAPEGNLNRLYFTLCFYIYYNTLIYTGHSYNTAVVSGV